MISLKKLWRDKRGNALVIAGAALPLVVGSAGLASDTIQWALWKRQLQRAADSAAIAGVYDRIYYDGATTNVPTAVDYDLGKNNHSKRTILAGYPQIAYPTGTNWEVPVRVRLAVQKKLGFSSLFLPNPPTIIAEATAATVKTGVYCVVSLINNNTTGIKMTGTAKVDLGCGMITNSTSLTAAVAGGNAQVYATPIAAVGDIKDSDNWKNNPELLPFTVKQDDPFNKVKPDTSMCPTSPVKLDVQWNKAMPTLPAAGHTTCYSGIEINGTVTLPAGTYVIDGGSLSFGPKAVVTCNGCTFVLTNQSTSSTATIGGIDINSTAELHLFAPKTGCTLGNTGCYDGILMYQDRRATLGGKQLINGKSGSELSGAMYFPRQELKIDGSSVISFSCAQFVAYVVEFAGTNDTVNTCTGGYGDKVIMGKHVRLVG